MADGYVLVIYFALGVVLGWCLHAIVLQLAYHMGIIEYKGRKQGGKP